MQLGTIVLTVDFADNESVKTAVLVLDQEIGLQRRALDELSDLLGTVQITREKIMRTIEDSLAAQHKLLRKAVSQVIGLEERIPKKTEIFIEPMDFMSLLSGIDTLLMIKTHSNAETKEEEKKDNGKKDEKK